MNEITENWFKAMEIVDEAITDMKQSVYSEEQRKNELTDIEITHAVHNYLKKIGEL